MYADGLSQVTLLEGLVRMDFFCAGEQAEDGKVTHEHAGRLLLPPVGFLRAYEAMGELISRMEEAGLVHRNTSAPAPAAQAATPRTSSPNFS